MKYFAVMLGVCLLAGAPVWAAQTGQKVERVLQNKVRAARQTQEIKNPVVSFTLNWEWDGRYVQEYSFRNRKAPGKPIRFGIEKGAVKTKTTTCLGAVVTGGKAVTHRRCFEAPNKKQRENFQLRSITLSLKDGRHLLVKSSALHHSGEFSFILLPQAFLQGVRPAPIHVLPQGKTLQDVYGKNFNEVKLAYTLKGSAVKRRPMRTRCMYHPSMVVRKIKIGEPLFLRGRLIALNSATPATFWQQIKNGGNNFVWTAFYLENGAAKLVE